VDALSDILNALRLSGGIYFRCDFGAPWGMRMGPGEAADFHIVVRGSAWLRLNEADIPIALRSGDIIVFPRGDAHCIADAPDTEPVPAALIAQNRTDDGYGPLSHGGDGPGATVLCGYFQLDRDDGHPLLNALPRLMHVRSDDPTSLAQLRAIVELIVAETESGRPGQQGVVNRLVEVLFIQIVRSYLQQADLPAGVLAGVADRHIGSALGLMHRRPGAQWTLDALATEARMSRSAFATRFRNVVGMTPMHYLTGWRMQKAKRLLADGRLSTAAVAAEVGYLSEASFSKAFKKAIGSGPGAYRRMQGNASTGGSRASPG
jgi:AraC-like DNA-binding protein